MCVHKVPLFLCQEFAHDRVMQHVEQPLCVNDLGLKGAGEKDRIL